MDLVRAWSRAFVRWLVDLRGRATISDGETDLLRSKLERLITTGVRKLLLNLAELNQVDSAGFGVVAKVCVSLREKGGDLRFIRPSGCALMAFKMIRMLDLIPTFDNEKEALLASAPKVTSRHPKLSRSSGAAI